MYKLQRTITANTELGTQKPDELSTEARYSNADVLILLMTILELQGQSISAIEKADGTCDFTIGDMTYTVSAKND